MNPKVPPANPILTPRAAAAPEQGLPVAAANLAAASANDDNDNTVNHHHQQEPVFLQTQVSNLSRGGDDNDDLDEDDDDDDDDNNNYRDSNERLPSDLTGRYNIPMASTSTWRIALDKAEVETARFCFPEGFTLHLIPLCTSVAALTFTGVGGWDCSFFDGAAIAFTGNRYGLWTLLDADGKCQLWDVLFFNFNLGTFLVAARVFSMTAMLLGLALVATMAQASQFHLASWGIGLAFFLMFVVSLASTSIYNVWVVFWLFTYAIMVLIIRAIFIHPVPRHISTRGSKIIAGHFLVCALCCLLTLVVLKSDFCTCEDITSERLEDRDVGKPCNGTCHLGWAGYSMVLACILWILAAVACLRFGIQPETLKQNRRRPKEWYAHYPNKSIVTRAKNFWNGNHQHHHNLTAAKQQQVSNLATKQQQQQQVLLDNKAWADKPTDSDPRVRSIRFDGDQEEAANTAAPSVVAATGLKAIHEEKSHHDLNLPNQSSSNNKNNNNMQPQQLVLLRRGEEHAANDSQAVVSEEQVDEEDEQEGEDYDTMAVDDPDNNNNNKRSSKKPNSSSVLDWSDLEDERGCMQKCCCDYRVEPRSRKERWMFWSFRTVLGIGFVIYALFVYMLIGSRSENTAAAKKPDTTPYFTTSWVCAFNRSNPYQPFQSFENKELAVAQNLSVAHCGQCGQCSNPHDIKTYVLTRQTIAKDSKQCGPKVFLGSYEDLADCLDGRIGFTRPCTYCWADNMENTAEKCLSTCMRNLFSGFMTDNNVPGAGDQGWLNQCLFCDEKNSGPDFVTCSGVARRRLGIRSEIERNPVEQCDRVDVDWVNVNWTDLGFTCPFNNCDDTKNNNQTNRRRRRL